MSATRIPRARISVPILAPMAVIATLQPEEARSVAPEPTGAWRSSGPAVAAAQTQSVDALVRRLGSPDAIERATAACRLAGSDPEVRHQAVWALGEIRVADAVPSLIDLRDVPDPEVQESAAWALGELGEPATHR